MCIAADDRWDMVVSVSRRKRVEYLLRKHVTIDIRTESIAAGIQRLGAILRNERFRRKRAKASGNIRNVATVQTSQGGCRILLEPAQSGACYEHWALENDA